MENCSIMDFSVICIEPHPYTFREAKYQTGRAGEMSSHRDWCEAEKNEVTRPFLYLIYLTLISRFIPVD